MRLSGEQTRARTALDETMKKPHRSRSDPPACVMSLPFDCLRKWPRAKGDPHRPTDYPIDVLTYPPPDRRTNPPIDRSIHWPTNPQLQDSPGPAYPSVGDSAILMRGTRTTQEPQRLSARPFKVCPFRMIYRALARSMSSRSRRDCRNLYQ